MTSTILDSGERQEFTTGAVRDIQEGKGRCDLLPLDIVSEVCNDPLLAEIGAFCCDQNCEHLYFALRSISSFGYENGYDMLLEVSKHFEDGALKYGEYNWQKGIPVHCYVDSAVRHYLKWSRGDTDERHDRAFVWNILCCAWTMKHRPEMNDLRKDERDA